MPFDSFGQIRPPEMAELGQNIQKQRFFRAFPGCYFVMDGRRDLKGLGVKDVHFNILCQIRPPEMAEFGQNIQKERFFET